MRYGILLLPLLAVSFLQAHPAMPWWGERGHLRWNLPELFRRAQDLAPDKAAELSKLEGEWIPKWMRQKTEVRIAAFALRRMLQDPKRTDKDLAQALDRLQEEKTRLFRIEKDALLALHRTLGAETFARLMKEPPMMHRLWGTDHRFKDWREMLKNMEKSDSGD